MKPTFAAADIIDPVRRQGRVAEIVPHVGRKPLEVSTRIWCILEVAAINRMATSVLHAQKLGHALIELVVSDARDV